MILSWLRAGDGNLNRGELSNLKKRDRFRSRPVERVSDTFIQFAFQIRRVVAGTCARMLHWYMYFVLDYQVSECGSCAVPTSRISLRLELRRIDAIPGKRRFYYFVCAGKTSVSDLVFEHCRIYGNRRRSSLNSLLRIRSL